MVTNSRTKDSGDDILLLKQKLEDGQLRLRSRLEQEEEAKASLMGRIQHLTKLILASTKSSQSVRFPHRPGLRRRHSFGEEETFFTFRRHSADNLSDTRHIKEVLESEDNYLGQETPLTSEKTMDQIDLLRQQHKILSGELALQMSGLKRLFEEAPQNPKIEVEMRNLKEEIQIKNNQIASLEKQIANSLILHEEKDKVDDSQVKAADNRIIQEQLNQKISECDEMQETVVSLRQQLSDTFEQRNSTLQGEFDRFEEHALLKYSDDLLLQQTQASECEELRRKLAELTESKEEVELRNKKLAEESSYAKGLASAAAVELKALSEEVTKLMNQNGRLFAELEAQKKSPAQRRTTIPIRNGRKDSNRSIHMKLHWPKRMKNKLSCRGKSEESKQREAYLENELTNMLDTFIHPSYQWLLSGTRLILLVWDPRYSIEHSFSRKYFGVFGLLFKIN
ncbi:hypothetical protein ACJIZ3_008102 [Penstemon smallii]|uniref:Uncharacterized protein n=1 Tax=Penstemon smallii TaxID=265156 RepID=A0ABD3T9Q6_9LAMI